MCFGHGYRHSKKPTDEQKEDAKRTGSMNPCLRRQFYLAYQCLVLALAVPAAGFKAPPGQLLQGAARFTELQHVHITDCLGPVFKQQTPQSKEGPGCTPMVDGKRLYVLGLGGDLTATFVIVPVTVDGHGRVEIPPLSA
jgi:hypothetical protein